MWATGWPPRNGALAGAWLVFAGAMAALMYVYPGAETIPYHLVWASFALLYGLVPWPGRLTWSVFAGITVVTGIPMLDHAHRGIIGWEECAEIALMALIAGLLVWHVDRLRAARRALAEVLRGDRARSAHRELATRFGSHELRTRLTIARGFVDLIRVSAADPRVRDEAGLAVAELDKAVGLSRNLITLVRLDGPLALEPTDVDELIDTAVRRWRARADRCWVAAPRGGSVLAHPERLEATLDCLIENAVKFTEPGDRIAIDAYLDGAELQISVSDSGAGIPAEDLDRVTELFHRSSNAADRPGDGLGLSIVRAAVEARGGSLHISSTLGSGTTVTLRVPHGRGASRHPGPARPAWR